mgnify:CR=1 FL=1
MAEITNKHIDKIKNIILGNLQRIVPQITDVEITMNKNYSGMEYIKAISTTFQTTPSLFKSVQIAGSAQPVENNETNTLVLYFNFSYYWETYSGGTNGTELGHMIFEIKNGHIRVKQSFTYSN